MWLAVDIGTTGLKAAILDMQQQIIATSYESYETWHGDHGVVEQDAHHWLIAFNAAVGRLDGREQVTRIVLTGQMQNVILIDGDGTPVRPVILYSDTRAREQAEVVTNLVDTAKMRAATGNKQGEGADGLPAKLLWLIQHESESLDRAQHLLFGAADFIAYHLTGNAASDSTTASTTGLLNMTTRQIVDAKWMVAPLYAMMPQIVAGGESVGLLGDEMAAALGLPAAIPVHIAPGDAGAATLGAGCGEIGAAYAYLGTSGWVAFSAEAPADFESGVITIAHPHPERTIQVAPLLTAGGNLTWVRDLFGVDDYDVLIEAAPSDPVNLLYLPYLNGERSPFIDPLARGAFIGMNATTHRAEMVGAVLAGVAMGYRHALEALMSVAPQSLLVTGMGATSDRWMQMFADVLNLPVYTAADAENVGLRGAIAAAEHRVGESYPTPETIQIAQRFDPDGARAAIYEKQFALFKDAYPALKAVYEGLGA